MTQPQAPVAAALTAVIPWGEAKVVTYVLNQQGHQLVRAGFIQVQKRSRRPEYDINLLAPALDTPPGHPAIWEKLLSHTIQEAARHRIERIYVDVPDQPLPVSSFAHVGFTTYARQTIWRLRARHPVDIGDNGSQTIRHAVDEDEWALQRLYAQVTPAPVQQAEWGQRLHAATLPPILYDQGHGVCGRFVLVEAGDVTGCLHVLCGRRGAWLRIWAGPLQPDRQRLRQLIRFGIRTVWAESTRIPVYVGVNDYHGGLSAVLDEFGFAPFTDRAKMVKQVLAWVKEGVPAIMPALESVGEAVTTPFVVRREPADVKAHRPTAPVTVRASE